jgi:hypothetical protein
MRKLATADGFKAILLFVAELNGYKKGNVTDKEVFGWKCFLARTIPHEPHEAIWAKRLYKELAGFQIAVLEGKDYYWSVPVELDVGASMLQIIGALLGDRQLLTVTNVISGGELSDPWGQIDGVSRSKAKKVLMRQLYGSSQSAAEILEAFEEDYTPDDIIRLEEGLHSGAYGVANRFKQFLIKNCNLAPVINPVVNEEQLEVPCNRHHIHGERPVAYKVVDSKGDIKTLVHWNTVKSPDLKSFKRWVVTGLIHALDSQIVDAIMAKLDWALDIHDAVICNPEDVWTVRKLYAKELTNIYNNRQSILNSYFKSIGIRATPAVQKEWSMIAKEVDTVETFNCSMWAMK